MPNCAGRSSVFGSKPRFGPALYGLSKSVGVCGNLRIARKFKRLVLLTPDDSNSAYIKGFRSLDPTRILHLEWRRVYEFLKKHQDDMGAVFSELTDQFLDLIHDTVFEQDIVGVILFIRFGKQSGIDPNTYLDEE